VRVPPLAIVAACCLPTFAMPDSVVYLNEGHDGMMFDPKTVTLD
jgi:hypothetical protein